MPLRDEIGLAGKPDAVVFEMGKHRRRAAIIVGGCLLLSGLCLSVLVECGVERARNVLLSNPCDFVARSIVWLSGLLRGSASHAHQ